MDPQALLDQLQPLRQPEAIGWWPPAPGWWLLTAAAVLAIVALSVWWVRRYRAGQYRRIAIAQLERYLAADTLTLGTLNQLLKATALRTWPSEESAALHGNDWLQFLSSSCPDVTIGKLEELADVYKTPDTKPSEQLIVCSRLWLKKHRRRHD